MTLFELRASLQYAAGFRLDVAFEAGAGVTALLGPSGSGKTTILSIIAGLQKPDSGFVRLGERVLFDGGAGINLPPESRRIGYVFQQHLLFPHLTARQNLEYGWRRRAEAQREIDRDRVVEVLDLGDLLERKPATLSGGQRQRVAVGRALLCAPELLLLDEPLASIDEERRQKALAYIERVIAEWSIPTLYVTHNAAELDGMASRTVRIRGGSQEE